MNNQMTSAVRKIHNLFSSGAVTVTGPNQPRILKQKVGSTTISSNSSQQTSTINRCYVCDEVLTSGQAQHQLLELNTSHTNTKFPNKIAQLVGEAFMVIVSDDDVVCTRCANLFNYLDRLENDVDRVRTNLMNLLHKKYGLNDEGGGTAISTTGGTTTTISSAASSTASPPIKIQKLNSGSIGRAEDVNELNRIRKIAHAGVTESVATVGKQSPPVSAVQQIKIATSQLPQQQTSAVTQTVQRKATRIYKCLTCDYKTSDMRLFNTHFETCKHQNFQCKNCKRIFPNFGAMKQHMVREHHTAMDNTCSVCHINFVNEAALRKHMELNHSTSVLVTSSTTLPASSLMGNTDITTTGTTTYTCNHCQFKSADKTLFDEHMRKHLAGVKPKPFKCRLCAQRFETREAATIHAKQHQPNFYKCGTCGVSFPSRDILVKHFEVHQQQASLQVVQQPTVQSSSPAASTTKQTNNTVLTTQKLLQETINEALSENVTTTTTVADLASNANIRFLTCHLCSLTFIQEQYYNQHMQTHRREKKNIAGTNVTNANRNNNSTMGTINVNNAGVVGGVGGSGGGENFATANNDGNDVNNVAAAHINSEADIESMFEKMHSDKGDTGSDSVTSSANNAGNGNENVVITSQVSGGITFNITIPQPDANVDGGDVSKSTPTTTASVSIDMPMLDQSDEQPTTSNSNKADNKGEDGGVDDDGKTQVSVPVSMPSLDDDSEADTGSGTTAAATDQQLATNDINDEKKHGEDRVNEVDNENTAQHETQSNEIGTEDGDNVAKNLGETDGEQQQHHVDENASNDVAAAVAAAEGGVESGEQHEHEQQLEEGTAVEGDQVTMELDEAMQAQGGQIKFILNESGQLLQLDNHILTDADGNQILVEDPEQIQQLLQSVGVLQSGDGLDGGTLQMMTDGNGQMLLVQGENNEAQLINASLLNADGHQIVIQDQDGELGEGAHVIGEDGTRIPVSVSYTADGQQIVQVQQQVLEANDEQAAAAQLVMEKEAAEAAAAAGNNVDNEGGVVNEGNVDATNDAGASNADGNIGGGGGNDGGNNGGGGGSSGGGGGFFSLDEMMQQSSENKATE